MTTPVLYHSDTKTPHAPSLLFIHGYAMDETIWKDVTRLLQNRYRIICIRLPFLENYTKNTGFQIAEQIVSLLIHLSVTSCCVWGHSLGGYIALEFTSYYQQMVTHLGLVHSTYIADTANKQAIRRKIIDHIRHYGKHSFLLQTVPSWYGSAYKQKNYHKIVKQIEVSNTIPTATFLAYQQYMIERKCHNQLMQDPHIKKTIILGEEDTLIRKENLDYQNWKSHGHLNVVSLQGVAHMSMLENPLLFAENIQKSFRK